MRVKKDKKRPSREIKCVNVKYWALSEQHKWNIKLNKGIVQHYKKKNNIAKTIACVEPTINMCQGK